MNNRIWTLGLLSAGLLPPTLSWAEEGGSGHYVPGSMASFMDTVPQQEAFVTRLNVLNYSADVDKNVAIPIAGTTAVNADVDSKAYGLTMVWRPSWGGLSERWSYAMGATIPYVELSVAADVETQAGATNVSVRRKDNASGLGDVVLQPLMLNYHHSRDLNYTARVTLYAPTGDYKAGKLANTGKNFWTVEPTVSVNYFGMENGREAQLFFGVDFNEENDATDYKSGIQAHLDGTLAQHFPLGEGLAGVGLTGYWYKQLTGDSGAGATFGDFKGEVKGLGVAASYTQKVGTSNLLTELKWVPESGAHRRLEGETVFLKIMLSI